MSSEQMHYVDAAMRTASDKFHGNSVSLKALENVLSDAIAALEELDKLRRAIYYNTELPYWFRAKRNTDAGESCEAMLDMLPDAHSAALLLHGLLGRACEGGEMLLVVYNYIVSRTQIDRKNIKEELGDSQWFDAAICKALDLTFEDVQATNIEKLKRRYAQKFSEQEANNRNLENERDAL